MLAYRRVRTPCIADAETLLCDFLIYDKAPFLNDFKLVLSSLVTAAICCAPSAALPDTLVTINPAEILEKKNGYLIVDLNLERDTGIITIGHRKRQSASRRNVIKSAVELGPFKAGRHLYLLSLPAGDYVWSEINVPHYDLPHRVNTSDEERWGMSVKADYLNYSGQIIVREGRSRNDVSIALVNRISHTLEALTAAYPDAFATYEIRYAGIYRDLFIESFLSSTEISQ